MELYVLLGWDGPDALSLRKVHRAAHLERLHTLARQDRVLLAGPMTDGAGSLLVMRFGTEEEARQWLSEDAYTLHGVFERTEVHPFRQVIPDHAD